MKHIIGLTLSLFVLSHSFAQKECGSSQYFQHQLTFEPGLPGRTESINKFLFNKLQRENISSPPGTSGNNISVIRIPVVVHVVYNGDEQRISETQVQSQIKILNNDFRKLNADGINTPAYFTGLATDCHIEFQLATKDPQGRATNGIVYKKTNSVSFGFDDKLKYSSKGGDDAWDADRYLNIWVANLNIGLVGYSSPLGSSKEKDGIVVRYTAFGDNGKVQAPNHLGRTAVHEIGHWLGLKHIWGDYVCGDDEISDTPPQKIATRGCPSGVIQGCNNSDAGIMYMNFMDLTNDACMNMFTIGQRERMRTLFAEGGPRNALLKSNGLDGSGSVTPIELPSETGTEIQIYPNPSNRIVTVRSSQELQQIFLYNHLGQQVFSGRISNGQGQVDISNLKAGIYYLKTAASANSFKLVKN